MNTRKWFRPYFPDQSGILNDLIKRFLYYCLILELFFKFFLGSKIEGKGWVFLKAFNGNTDNVKADGIQEKENSKKTRISTC